MNKKIIRAGDLEVHQKNCGFCSDPLPLNSHKGRKFCPEKYGISEYCKYQMKKIIEQERLVGLKPVVTIKDKEVEGPSKTAEDSQITVTDGVTQIVIEPNESRTKNLNLIHQYLGGREEVLIDIDKMLSDGYDFSVYDAKQQLFKSELFHIEIDDYSLIWYSKNKLLLTKTIEIICHN